MIFATPPRPPAGGPRGSIFFQEAPPFSFIVLILVVVDYLICFDKCLLMLKSKSVIELIMCWLNVCVNDLKIKNWKVSWTKMIYAYVMKAMWKVFECIEMK